MYIIPEFLQRDGRRDKRILESSQATYRTKRPCLKGGGRVEGRTGTQHCSVTSTSHAPSCTHTPYTHHTHIHTDTKEEIMSFPRKWKQLVTIFREISPTKQDKYCCIFPHYVDLRYYRYIRPFTCHTHTHMT